VVGPGTRRPAVASGYGVVTDTHRLMESSKVGLEGIHGDECRNGDAQNLAQTLKFVASHEEVLSLTDHTRQCVFYYCRTYYKTVRVGEGGIEEDMCYERRRAEACVD